MQVPVVELQPILRVVATGLPRHIDDRRVHRERKKPAGAQQSCRLRDRAKWIGERHCTVVAEDDVKRRGSQPGRLRAGVEERKVDARSRHQNTRLLELTDGVVKCRDACPQTMQRDRPLGRAAAEFEHVAAARIAEHSKLRLR